MFAAVSFITHISRRSQMSLADELLADLEEAGEEGEDDLYGGAEEGDSDGEGAECKAEGMLEDIPEEMELDYAGTESVSSIAKLRDSKQVSWEDRLLQTSRTTLEIMAGPNTEIMG